MAEDCMQEMPQPTAEHNWLTSKAGTWDVECTMWMGPPDQPPMKCSGTDVVEAIGGFWISARFNCDMGGMPFVGQCQAGYNEHTKKFVQTWVDSFCSQIMQLEGSRKSDGSLEMKGIGWGAMGPHTHFRSTEDHHSPDSMTFRMFCSAPGGPEVQTMQFEYKRRK